RLNTSLLSSDRLHDRTVACFQPYRSSFSWEATKTLARSCARDYAVLASRGRRSDLQVLERQLAQARHASARDIGNDVLAARVVTLHDQLASTVTMATSRAVLRARVRWLEEGETCSSYFFSRFRSRSDQSSTVLLRNADGSHFRSALTRQHHVHSYFSHVYAAPLFS